MLAGIVLAGADPASALALPAARRLAPLCRRHVPERRVRRRDRRAPSVQRPIPSGRSAADRFRAGFGMLAAGVLLFLLGGWGAALAALVLAALIVLYNWHHKANPLSPVVMGLCRVMVYVAAALPGGSVGAAWLGAALRCSLPDRPHLRREAGAPERARRPLAARLPSRRSSSGPPPGAGWLTVLSGLPAWVLRPLLLFRPPRVLPAGGRGPDRGHLAARCAAYRRRRRSVPEPPGPCSASS